MNLNKAQIIGRVTRDPELKTLPSGTSVVKFSIATNHVYKDKDGKKQESAQYHNCVLFGKAGETFHQYVKKGQEVYVDGRIETRDWEKDGIKKTATEIVVENFQFGQKAKEGGSTGYQEQDPTESIDVSDIDF